MATVQHTVIQTKPAEKVNENERKIRNQVIAIQVLNSQQWSILLIVVVEHGLSD